MSFVSRIYCISLRNRDDRYQQSVAELKKAGWLDRTEFYRPEKHAFNGNQGCYESHQAIIRLAQQRREKYILILEDDFVMEGQVVEEDIQQFKTLGNTADIYFLGHFPVFLYPMIGTRLWRCRSWATHAYILNTKGNMAQKIANYPYLGKPVDFLYALEAVAYTSCPMICFQRSDTASSIFSSSAYAFIVKHHRLFSKIMECVWHIFWWSLLLYCFWKSIRPLQKQTNLV